MDKISKDLSQLRQDYQKLSLSEHEVDDNPVVFFKKWFQQAIDAQEYEPNAMTLATVSADGVPSARIVLLKGIENDEFVFFTNYNSLKGQQMSGNPHVALVFFWKSLERQVRIQGKVKKLSEADSKAYFHSRPYESQIGAIASPQSTIIPSREWLEQRFVELKGSLTETTIQKPEHWGGWTVYPEVIEFWQGRPSRLHDRVQCIRISDNEWKKVRLAP